MELRHLRYFVAVAEEASFTRAAARLGIAQPPLSQQIARLERELGVELLTRTSRGATVTRAGDVLLAEARVVLQRAEETTRAVRRVGLGESGLLRIGVVASAFHGTLVPGLRLFRRRHPDVQPVVHEVEALPQREALVHGGLDIGFQRTAGPVPGTELHRLPLEPLRAVLPSTHPLAGAATVRVADLRGEPFVLFPRASAPEAFDAIVGTCHRAGFVPDIVHESGNDHSLLGVVAAGLAVSLVPEGTTRVTVPEVVYRPVAPYAHAAPLAVLLPETSTPAARLLLAAVRDAGAGAAD